MYSSLFAHTNEKRTCSSITKVCRVFCVLPCMVHLFRSSYPSVCYLKVSLFPVVPLFWCELYFFRFERVSADALLAVRIIKKCQPATNREFDLSIGKPPSG